MRTWAGIVRVSHMGKRKAGAPNVHTDRDQIEAINAATPTGGRLHMLAPELDVSGGLPLEKRPSLHAAVRGVESGKYAGIIVAYQSRLFRNVEEEEAVWRRVEAAGGEVLLALDGLDTKTVNGRMVRRIKAAINTAEREEHAERFDRRRELATAAGIWQRRQTPRGYDKDPETRALVPNGQAGEVRSAFRRRGGAETISQLARELGMTQSGVRALLRNRVYLGELRVGKHVNPDAHSALVTEDEFAAAQAVRATRPARSAEPVALLAGLVRCRSCGHVMSRSIAGGNRRTYLCHRHHSAGLCPKPAGITLATLEDHVTAIARAELAKLTTRAAGRNGDLVGARKAVRNAERELAAYLEGVQAAGLEPGQWAEGARRRREALDDARARHAELASRQTAAFDGDPVKAWEKMDAAQRNRLLRSLIECVVVTPVGRGKRVPVEGRVRVVRHGAGLVEPYGGGGVAMPIRRVLWPDADSPVVLRVHLGEDLLERPGR
jgi:DNA invertase Pin-like site-specific DNA recombinase